VIVGRDTFVVNVYLMHLRDFLMPLSRRFICIHCQHLHVDTAAAFRYADGR